MAAHRGEQQHDGHLPLAQAPVRAYRRRRPARRPAATFVLRDISQLSYAETAEQLNIPEGTVKARVHTARQVVRELLDTTRHT
ncbi:sigma factor-like helix-turn-helix DNA-binding protein [Actinosynnema sp. ALI-1.44]|uniref:sigma factor-like helix-turn-helix DNA-binding protein n=1 Tax=Actinosynnema sp. ALI-1.44 TaxID=1933779 RepID=UPI00192CF69B|nr:sigma factor-like helix-turn-helix DNA-binding protein [Actinosynnema sp. ALI-1.44]